MEPNAEYANLEKVTSEKRLQPAAHSSITCRWMSCGSSKLPLFTTGSCPSSMDVAWRLSAELRFPGWASVLSATQSSGRGQFGRTWISPPGNVYGTVRIPRLGPVWSDLAPLMLAEAMRRVLRSLGVAPAIKWPNDLIVGGKKVGGVLLETRSGIVMAGLGLNLVSAPPPHELRHPLAQPAGCLEEFGVQRKPMEVWISFVCEARSLIRHVLLTSDPERFVDSLTPHQAYILLDAYAAGGLPALYLGVDAGGAIKVLTSEGERIFRSGSIYPMMQRYKGKWL
jgi:BirA family biotin operon repressor/biotin-[acetyl-CoA-carboxylase] ligase